MTPPEPRVGSSNSLASILWLNLFFWTAVVVVTAIFVIGATCYVCIFLLIFRNRRRGKWLVRRSISHYGALVLKCGWPLVKVRYVDHAPHESPPFVFVSNHRSASDAFLMACLPFECIQVLNNWPSRLPVVGPVAWIAGYLKVRKMSPEAFVEAGSRLLADGVSIIAFPEGTRSGSRKIGSFHGSAFRLAQRARANIALLAIAGNEDIPKRGSLVLHPGRITVSKLPSVTYEQYKDMTAFKLKTLVRERIRQHLDAQRA
ncbi:MAG: lysophospholipid acyltransferase family protein [Tepidisphaeraceae bacterium]